MSGSTDDFKPNIIKLSAWGNQEAVRRGQINGSKGLKHGRKVTCMSCFKRFSTQAFRYHRQTPECKGARGER